MSNKAIKLFKDYIVITLAVIIMDLGIYAFKFPNHFSFGGVSGLAVVLNEILGISAAQINLVINLALLVIGFAVLGKSFESFLLYGYQRNLSPHPKSGSSDLQGLPLQL